MSVCLVTPVASVLYAREAEVKQIIRMLAFMRPAFSRADDKFIEVYIAPTGATPDKFGNYILRIGTAPILWSCHTDTVHRISGFTPPDINMQTGMITVGDDEDANCLGADCTAGVWLMLEMIKAKVEGLYIFHRAEEEGGKGSHFIAEQTPEVLKNIKYAIAFDRYGYSSIITYQCAARCCSDDFAEALSKTLADGGIADYKTDEHGLFTDTAFYTKIIPECTNISVGYFSQHCKSERQDVVHLIKLRDALISADFTNLPVTRDVNEVDKLYSQSYGDGEYSDWPRRYRYKSTIAGLTVMDVVEMYPDRVANMLEQKGVDANDLLDMLEMFY